MDKPKQKLLILPGKTETVIINIAWTNRNKNY